MRRLDSLRMTIFDTLAAARGLEEAGMDVKQAAAVTGTIRAAVAEDGLVTRADLDAGLAKLETRMKRTQYALVLLLLAGQLASLALIRLMVG